MHHDKSEEAGRAQDEPWQDGQADKFGDDHAHNDGFGSYGSFGAEETLVDPATILAEDPAPTSETEPFPVHVLPPFLAEAAREFARAALVPESMAVSAMLGCLSAAPGAGIEVITYGDKRTRANLFLLIVARTGSGKDEIMNLVSSPLEQHDAELLEEWRREKRPKLQAELYRVEKAIKEKTTSSGHGKSQEGSDPRSLEELERRRQEIERDLRAEPAIIVKDATKEAMEDLIRFQPGEALASISAEGRGIVDVLTGRYSKGKSTDEDFYTCGFSGTPCKVNRKGRDSETIRLNRPCLALLWMLQPRVFRRELLESEKMVDSGLLGRFPFFEVLQGPPQIPRDHQPFSGEIMSQWGALLRELLGYRNQRHEIRATSMAAETLFNFDNDNRRRLASGGDLEDIADFAVRRGEIAWKFGLTIHCGTHGKESHLCELDLDAAHAAVTIVQWYARQAENMLHANRARVLAKRLADLTLLVTSNGGAITFRDLKKSHGFTDHEIARLVQKSQGRFEIVERQNPKGGRRSYVVRLRQNSQNSQNPC